MTDNEATILRAFSEASTIEALATATGKHVSAVHTIVRNLTKKEFIECDDEGHLTMTEPGTETLAALMSDTAVTLPDQAPEVVTNTAAPTAVKLDYTAAKMALALNMDARDVRRNLRALFGKLPDGVTGWHWQSEDDFTKARDSVAARIEASAK